MLALGAAPARADSPLVVLYQGHAIRLTHLDTNGGAIAIGVGDPGFATLLRDAGAWLTWKPGERYILITTSAPAVASFAMGDRRYDVGTIALQAPFAPYARGNEAYLPLNEVLRALDLALRQDGSATVLQPQLASFDVRRQSNGVTLAFTAGAPIRARVLRQNTSQIVYAFAGVGTALSGTQTVSAAGIRSMQIQTSGPVRNPTTLVTIALDPGTVVRASQSGDRAVLLSAGAGAPAQAQPEQEQTVAEESPTPEPAPAQTGASATVTGVSLQASSDGVAVAIAVTGDAAYQWHRLRDPDNRFWVDLENTQLQGPPVDQSSPAAPPGGGSSPILSMRARQIDPTTVRIALTLDGPKSIAITPSATGLLVDVASQDVADAPRAGNGSVGTVVSAGQQTVAAVTPAALDDSSSDFSNPPTDTSWKFGPHGSYVPTSPRLIVIDPGHGGSDRGTTHGGLEEANLTLDMAKRLRDLLVAQGWQVKLTHDTDVDVYQPNDSAHDELQARVDVANNAGARMFVSIHVNAFINSGPSGTTTYISKPDDVALGKLLETSLASDGTKDDGVVKAHYYVTYHTRMPAVLIETAFLTNPADYALLSSAAWRQKVAQEIAAGIAQYARQYPVPNQPAQ